MGCENTTTMGCNAKKTTTNIFTALLFYNKMVQVRLSRCLIKHHAMKSYEGAA